MFIRLIVVVSLWIRRRVIRFFRLRVFRFRVIWFVLRVSCLGRSRVFLFVGRVIEVFWGRRRVFGWLRGFFVVFVVWGCVRTVFLGKG